MKTSIESFAKVYDIALSGASAVDVLMVAQNLGLGTGAAKLALQRAHGYSGWVDEYSDPTSGNDWK